MFDVIAFDADDTLWHNESIFTMTQQKFREMLSSHAPEVVDQNFIFNSVKESQALRLWNQRFYSFYD
jgi:FMN phosphatase YigB (HAD superfamily)